jgi:anthranilate phosphoribosyltransferase
MRLSFTSFATALSLFVATTAPFASTTTAFSPTTTKSLLKSTTTTLNMSKSGGASLKPYIETLIDGKRHLSCDETKDAFSAILKGADEVQVGSFLTLLRARGENPDEIAGAVEAMNDACNSVDLGEQKLLDIVGTGGDGADTINISTASTVLAAACGCIVAKAGNRSVSSACGSADVLEALGVKVDLTPNQVVECVNQIGIAFMFAPVNHPAMKYVAPVRSKLGVRTVFNILGPMTNAAGASRAVIGVFHPELMDLMAGALTRVGRVDHAVIIHGIGLDEISPLGPATLLEIKNIAPDGEPKVYETKTFEFDPLDIGIPRCELIDLKGGGPKENANKFVDVLKGGSHTDAKRDSIVLNAGVGCWIYGLSNSIEDGCKLARTTLESGKASTLLQKWITVSQEIASSSSSSSASK